MTDLIIFSVGNNKYALNIENIQRIIQATKLTDIPNTHTLVDGMMSYEDSVIKVLNFRKLIGIESYNEELHELFSNLKNAHTEWIDALKHAIDSGSNFTKTTDPHKCELGKWLDNFNSYDDRVTQILKQLVENHKYLHTAGHDALELNKSDNSAAQSLVDTKIYDAYTNTIGAMNTFIEELDGVADSLQKFIIYEKDGNSFAIKVDLIEDIAHIDDSSIINSTESSETNEFLELDGVLDLDGVLINVIKTVNIPN